MSPYKGLGPARGWRDWKPKRAMEMAKQKGAVGSLWERPSPVITSQRTEASDLQLQGTGFLEQVNLEDLWLQKGMWLRLRQHLYFSLANL